MADPYTTALNPADELRYQVWRSMLPKALQYDGDYDLRGAYQDGLKPSDNAHFNDKYKKPNHPTFSDESMYSTPENPGGTWAGDDNAGWTFNATPANLAHHTPDALLNYFQAYEPGSKVVLPKGTR
jgi:hypothetical protein